MALVSWVDDMPPCPRMFRQARLRRPCSTLSPQTCLQLGPNAQNGSIQVCHLLSPAGTLTLGGRLDHRQDRRSVKPSQANPAWSGFSLPIDGQWPTNQAHVQLL